MNITTKDKISDDDSLVRNTLIYMGGLICLKISIRLFFNPLEVHMLRSVIFVFVVLQTRLDWIQP